MGDMEDTRKAVRIAQAEEQGVWWEQEPDRLGEAPATCSGHTPASTQHFQLPPESSPGGCEATQVPSLDRTQDEIPGSKLSKNQPILAWLDSKPHCSRGPQLGYSSAALKLPGPPVPGKATSSPPKPLALRLQGQERTITHRNTTRLPTGRVTPVSA